MICSRISSAMRKISSMFWNSVRWSVGEIKSRRSANGVAKRWLPYCSAVTKCCSRLISWYKYFRGESSILLTRMDCLAIKC